MSTKKCLSKATDKVSDQSVLCIWCNSDFDWQLDDVQEGKTKEGLGVWSATEVPFRLQ